MIPSETTPRTPGDVEAGHRPVEVFIQGLCRRFGDHEVLRGVDLIINRGEMVAIVGGSGCGKTVLLKHLTGHLRPDSGLVALADHESPGAPLRDLASISDEGMDAVRIHCAVVFQRNALLTGTVFHNLALWLREIKRMKDRDIRPLAVEAIAAVGLDPRRVLDLPRENLSGGMAKRVAIARALVMDPALVLYDEPTSGLDPEHAANIHELIRATHDRPTKGGIIRTSIIVTHDTELLRRLQPRVVMLHDGRVFFDGPYSAFSASTEAPIRPYFARMPILQARTVNDGSS